MLRVITGYGFWRCGMWTDGTLRRPLQISTRWFPRLSELSPLGCAGGRVTCRSGWSADEHMACPQGALRMICYVCCVKKCCVLTCRLSGLGWGWVTNCNIEMSLVKICNSSLFQALKMHLQWHEQAAGQAHAWLCVLVHPVQTWNILVQGSLFFPLKCLANVDKCWWSQKGVQSEKCYSWVSFPGPNQGMGWSHLIWSCFQACGICPY